MFCQTLEWVCHPSDKREDSDQSIDYSFSQHSCASSLGVLGTSLILNFINGILLPLVKDIAHIILVFFSGPDLVVFVMDWMESVTEYMRLGMELGLSYALLNKIRQEQGRKVEDCKRTLLQSWLERADRVDEMGGTNKPALVAALRRMGEHRVADSIISGLRCSRNY